MARPGVTYSEVAQAGQNPTVDTVQAPFTAQAEVEGLRQRLDDHTQAHQDVKQHLAQAQANLEHYREAVQRQRAEERAETEHRIRQLETERQAVREENQALQAAVRHGETEQARLQAERDQVQMENASLSEQVEQLNQDVANTQQRLAEGAGRYQALARAYQEIQEKLQEREQEGVEQEKSRAVAQEKIQTLTTTLEKAEAKIEGLQDENRILAQEKAAIEGQFKQWQRAL